MATLDWQHLIGPPGFLSSVSGIRFGCFAGVLNPSLSCTDPTDVVPDEDRVDAVTRSLRDLSTTLFTKDCARRQACMRPCTDDGLPMMGRVPGTENAFICTGHNCWGILWAPASGLAMAELITTGKSSINLHGTRLLRHMCRCRAHRSPRPSPFSL